MQQTKPSPVWSTDHTQIPAELQTLPFWMKCTKEKVAPYSDKPESWYPWIDAQDFTRLAFQYTVDHPIICIDLDDMNDPEIIQFISENPTYAEASPSGAHKAHIFYQLPVCINKADYISKPKRNNGKTELFLYNHYTTITGNSAQCPLHSLPRITLLTEEQAGQLFFLFPQKSKVQSINKDVSPLILPNLTKAIKLIDQWIDEVELDPNSSKVQLILEGQGWTHYDYWLKALQCIHYIYQGSAQGLIKADEWSQKDPQSYAGFNSVQQKWSSFSVNRDETITERTFFLYLSWFKLEFPDQNQEGMPKLNSYDNFLAVLNHIGVQIKIDAISLRPFIQGHASVIYPNFYESSQEARYANLDTIMARLYIQIIKYLPMTYDQVVKFTQVTCDKTRPQSMVNHFKTLIDSKPWDRMDRLSQLISAYHLDNDDERAPTPELAREYIKRWMYSVIRTFYMSSMPKAYQYAGAEGMLIIAGTERTNKTSSFMALLPESCRQYYVSTHLALDGSTGEKDTLMKIAGNVIVVFDEAENTINSNKQGKIKEFITRQSDTFRVPYGRAPKEFPRMCSFAGTLNQDRLNIPDDGARRYWALVVTYIDVPLIDTLDKQQLWAQVKYELLEESKVNPYPPWNLPESVRLQQKQAIKSFASFTSLGVQLYDMYDWSFDYKEYIVFKGCWATQTKSMSDIARDLDMTPSAALTHELVRILKSHVLLDFHTSRGEVIKQGIYKYRKQPRYLMPPKRSIQLIEEN